MSCYDAVIMIDGSARGILNGHGRDGRKTWCVIICVIPVRELVKFLIGLLVFILSGFTLVSGSY